MGWLIDRTEVSMAQAAFGNGGHSNLYVTSGGFSITDYQLKNKGQVDIQLFQTPGETVATLSYMVIFEPEISRFAWDAHRIEYH